MRFPKVSTTNINGLPLGYTEVEYLEGSGTQYIDTGYIPNNKSEIEIVCNSGGIQGTNLFGYRNASASSKNITITTSSTGTTVFYTIDFNNSNYNTYRYNFESNANQILKIKLSKSERSVYNSSETRLGGNLVSCPDVFTCDSTAYLMNVAGTPFFTECFKGKVYSCKISESGVLVRDFIPCLDSNNRPCMYDRVERKPYYNLGTGEFSYGKKIYGVEYLESTGTQYIDTGLKGKSSYDFAYKFNSIIDGNAYGIGGEWESGKSCYLGVIRNNNKFAYHYQNTQSPVEVQTLVNNTDYEVQAHLYSGEQYYVINGIKSTVGTISGTFTSTVNMCLFAVNSSTTKTFSNLKMYFCKIWDNGTLIRDYIPVRDENDVGYMFDKVTHSLYENNGTGAFVVGGDTLGKSSAKLIRTKTTVSGLPYGYTEIEYLESNGNQYIDTGIQPTDTYGYRVRNTYTAGAGEQCAIGSMDSGNRFVGIYTSGSANGISGAWGDYVGFLPSYTWATGTILDVKGNYKNNRKLIIDSTELKDITDTHISGTIDNTVYLFARHYGSTITKMRGRMYSAEITNGQDVIYKFIPALDLSNRPCMYDIVEGKAYYNQGTGEFTYGPKIIPVEYIENTGSSYIDTGYNPNSNTKVEAKFVMKENTTNFKWLFLARNENAAGSGFGFGAATNGVISSEYNNRQTDTAKFISGQTYIITKDKNVCKYNDSSLTNPDTTFTVNYSLPIFALNNIGTIQSGTMPLAECHYFKIYDNNTLVRDYIPVKNENGVGYMFDKIGHTLYANKGTGSFVVGNEKRLTKVRFIEDTSVISEYTKLKCLISSGTQYIDTGYNPTPTSTYKSTFELTNITTTAGAWFCVFGSVESNNSTFTELFLPRASGSGDVNQILAGSHNSTYLRKDYTWVKDTKYNFEMTPTDVLINGVNQGSISTDSSLTCSHSIYLFARHEYNDAVRYNVNAKIYQFNIFNNGILVRDFIPVLRNSDNKPGMYDRVTKTFFTNQGTGEFTYETL